MKIPVKDKQEKIAELRERAWEIHGRNVTFYLPGMFRIDKQRGRYPGLSITGRVCRLQCAHCKGRLLRQMVDCSSPDVLLRKCLELDALGYPGCLITGGSSRSGELPWREFLPTLRKIVERTSLQISVHSGLADEEIVRELAETGVARVMLDVVGSDDTLANIHNLTCGIGRIENTLRLLSEHSIHYVPHIVVGIDHGRIIGEYNALQMVRRYNPPQVNLVVFMPLPGTPLAKCKPPKLEEVWDVFITAREMFMDIPLSLGCGRPRGAYSIALEKMALDLGFNKIALWNDESLEYAKELGLDVKFKMTCCSL
ncbi:radical SAM protein [Candidatus Sumerlaeota bacterium]|nr:radical SAM protein [Candidatus Sumerlaeota bacterium]